MAKGNAPLKFSAQFTVGHKVNSKRAVQFHKWATTIKGFVMDDDRLIAHNFPHEPSSRLPRRFAGR